MFEYVKKNWICEGGERFYYEFDKQGKMVYTYYREVNEYTLQYIKGE